MLLHAIEGATGMLETGRITLNGLASWLSNGMTLSLLVTTMMAALTITMDRWGA